MNLKQATGFAAVTNDARTPGRLAIRHGQRFGVQLFGPACGGENRAHFGFCEWVARPRVSKNTVLTIIRRDLPNVSAR
jgi:hypothetical protein